VFALDAMLAPAFVIGARLLLTRIDDLLRPHSHARQPALIYGAGNAGALALRELWQNRDLALAPVGILDDDTGRHGREIDGVPVIGGLDQLERLIAQPDRPIAAVVIAIKDLPADRLERITTLCEAAGVELRRLRFALEPIERRDRTSTIVKFPGA
jgi:FlaA1/EpsC-like NDP-sugar epimerase